MERIDVNNYTVAFDKYSDDFQQFVKEYKLKPPTISRASGQGIALLTCQENRGKYALREDLEAFFRNIGMETKDAIQTVNKCEQWGLKRASIKGKYAIPYPFVYYPVNLMKRANTLICGNRDEIINATKEFIKVNYLEVPNHLWQVGHINPHSEDNSEANLIYQPPIQGKYRDKYKFDKLGLTKYPTGKELCVNMSKYYSDDEQKLMLETLMQKFNIQSKNNID